VADIDALSLRHPYVVRISIGRIPMGPNALQYSERVLPHEADQATHRRVYERAGPKAFEDYWAKRPQNRNRWP